MRWILCGYDETATKGSLFRMVDEIQSLEVIGGAVRK